MSSSFFTDNSVYGVAFAKMYSDVCDKFGFFYKNENSLIEKDFDGLNEAFMVPFLDLGKIKIDVVKICNYKFASDFIVLKGNIPEFYPFAELKKEGVLKSPMFLIVDEMNIPLKEQELFILDMFDKIYFSIMDENKTKYVSVLNSVMGGEKGQDEKKFEIYSDVKEIKKDILEQTKKQVIRYEAVEIK